jgi:hypothetical protein
LRNLLIGIVEEVLNYKGVTPDTYSLLAGV